MTVEKAERWREISDALPYIPMRGDWAVRVMPPITGALARFCVRRGNANVSVYCDEYCRLGGRDDGYWEIFPDNDGDNARFSRDDADELAAAIEKSLAAQEAKPVVDALMSKIKALSPSQRSRVVRFVADVDAPPDIFEQMVSQAFAPKKAGAA